MAYVFSQPDEERPSRACDDPDALPLPDLRLDVATLRLPAPAHVSVLLVTASPTAEAFVRAALPLEEDTAVQAGSGTIARLVVVRGAEAAVLCVNATLPHEHAHELSLQALQALRPAGVLVLAEQPAEMRVAFSGVAVVRSTALPAPESARVPLLPCPMLAEGVPAALLAHCEMSGTPCAAYWLVPSVDEAASARARARSFSAALRDAAHAWPELARLSTVGTPAFDTEITRQAKRHGLLEADSLRAAMFL